MADEENHLCELVELYALDALTAEETAAFTVHLNECRECANSVADYRRITELLPLASEPIEPPAGMRSRVLSKVLASDAFPIEIDSMKPEGGQRTGLQAQYAELRRQADSATPQSTSTKRGTPVWRYVSLGLAAAVAVLVIYTGQLRQDVDRLQQNVISMEPVHGLKVNQSVALNPVDGTGAATGLASIVADSRGNHLVVQAERLPELTGTEAYQVWLIKGKESYSAGTFVSQDGTGAIYYSFQPQNYDTVAITLEPDAVGDTPRGRIVLAAPIKQG